MSFLTWWRARLRRARAAAELARQPDNVLRDLGTNRFDIRAYLDEPQTARPEPSGPRLVWTNPLCPPGTGACLSLCCRAA
ncbi:MAG: hypothetical protein AAFR35_12195 [Pseudomonadota bacterium]